MQQLSFKKSSKILRHGQFNLRLNMYTQYTYIQCIYTSEKRESVHLKQNST